MTRAVSDSFAHRALLGLSLTFVALGIAPVDRQSWFVENIMVLLVVAALWCKRSRPALSRSAWCATLLFLLIHQIGAHYTYPDVPYNTWLLNVFSLDLNGLMGWERNHYDRFVHLAYGLLLSVPIRELSQQMGVKPRYVAFIAWNLVMSTSAVYELMEWLAVRAAPHCRGSAGRCRHRQHESLGGPEWAAALHTARSPNPFDVHPR
jgi:putative membrane protein